MSKLRGIKGKSSEKQVKIRITSTLSTLQKEKQVCPYTKQLLYLFVEEYLIF